MKKLAILLGIFLFLLPISAQATQPSFSTIKIPIFPLYRQSMASDTNYNYTLSVSPPDGLTSVITAIVSFNAQINGQTQNFTLWVNGKSCNNPFYYIATAFSTTGNTQFYFDCSNVITKRGNYTITIRSEVNTGVISGWLDLTYINNPYYIQAGGTEYQFGQNATVFVRLLDANNKPINLGSCNTSIFYPNKTYWVQNANTTLLDSGYYYRDLGTVPSDEGVYMVSFDCIVPSQLYRQTQQLYVSIPNDNSYVGYFPFDNVNNLTITSANMSVKASKNGAVLNVSFNGNFVYRISGLTATPTTYTFPIGIGNFSIADSQAFTLYTVSGGPILVESVSMDVNYTSFMPQQIIRGQTELHVSGSFANLTVQLNASQNITALSTFANGKYVGGTEYISGDRGRTLAQITKISSGNQEPVLTATCSVNITYPNGTAFITNGNAPFLTASNGLYYYNFTVPSTEGVYAVDYKCVDGSKEYYISGTFHVSNYIAGNLSALLTGQANIIGNLSSMTNYLITINGTTFQINQSQYSNYLSLLSAINSVNATATANQNLLVAINGSLANLTISELSHYNSLIAFLASINTTLNTTLEYKLDLINGTVMQINQSQTAYYLSLWGAIESVGATLNGTITQYLVVINDTTYNLSVNEYNHYLSVLQAISSVNSSVNSLNLSQYQDYLSLYNLLIQINQTGNTTLELVTSINQSLLSDYISLYNLLYSVNGNILNLNASEYQHFQELFVILTDINYTTNNTLEYKLDLINYTTWQSWMILQNLTIGNLTVFASINWSEGVPFIWNASGQSQINYSLLSLSNQGIQLVVETLTCISNSTLIHTLNITNCVFGQCLDSVRNITEVCATGCVNNQCLPAPQFQYFYGFGFILLLLAAIYFVWQANKKTG